MSLIDLAIALILYILETGLQPPAVSLPSTAGRQLAGGGFGAGGDGRTGPSAGRRVVSSTATRGAGFGLALAAMRRAQVQLSPQTVTNVLRVYRFLGRACVSACRGYAPVKTGRLKAGIRLRERKVGSDVEYAKYVEKYRPFMSRTFNTMRAVMATTSFPVTLVFTFGIATWRQSFNIPVSWVIKLEHVWDRRENVIEFEFTGASL